MRIAAATAAKVSILAGKHDGANDDAQPDGTTDDDAAHNDDEPARAKNAAC